MPMTPALGLLCAQYFVSGVREGFPWPRLHKTAVAIAFLPLLLGGIALAAFPWYADRWAAKAYESEPALRAGILALFTPLAVAVIVAVAVSIVASVIIAWRLNTRKRAPLPLAFIVLLFTLVAAFLIFPPINPDKSFRNFCAKMLPYLEKADKIYLYNDNFDGAINLFTGINRFPILRSEGRKGDPGELARIMQGPAKVAIIAKEKEISSAVGRLSGAKVLVRHNLQKHRLVLVGNWEESEKESGRFETKTLPTASKPSSLIIPN